MKILRITDIGYETGGVETGIILLQHILEEKGHIIRTLANDARPDLPHFNQYSFKRLPWLRKIFYSFNPYSYSALKKALKHFKPDVVHIHTIGEASASVLFPLKNYPTVLTVHGPEAYSKNLLLWCFPESNFKHGTREIADLNIIGKLRFLYHKYINDPIYKAGFQNVNEIVTLSNYMHDLMNNEGLINQYVPNGINLFPYSPIDKEAINHTLLYVGRLEKYKGVDYLISALPDILESFPDARLDIVGAGSDKPRLEKLVNELNLATVVAFLGHVSHENLEPLYKRSSLIIMPSAYPEAFGKVGIEAMSVGRPVVATDVGGVRDWLIHGATGFIVPPNNAAALSAAVIGIFSDPDLYINMMALGRKKSEEFELSRHAELMENIYNSAIKKKKSKK